jgi:hypothetical protein
MSEAASDDGASGGCQCGAVRYRVTGGFRHASICHCRMCQKAFGGYFAPLASVALDRLAWTRGRPAEYRSSNLVTRGFCRDCGTPLTYAVDGSGRISIALGSLDDPAAVVPEIQYGIEGRMPWFAGLAALPGTTTDDDPEAFDEPMHSRQHPDHDTVDWPADRGR